MQKKELRKQILAKRKQLSEETRQVKSESIVEKVYGHPLYQQSQLLFTFVPFGHEVNIRPLLDKAVEDGKHVAIPRADVSKRELSIYLFNGWDRLVPGVYGILEPDPAHSKRIDPAEIDLIFMPGVGFDRRGGRLGYGGGFYDRFLAKLANCPPLIAPCFSEQIMDQIPVEGHDFIMDYIITDVEIVKC